MRCWRWLSAALRRLPQDEGAEEAPDPWIGCWSRVYDAVHLAKHPGQKVAAMTLSIAAREGASGDAPGNYLAKVTALLRDKPDTYANPGGARCVVIGRRRSPASPTDSS